MVRGNEGKNERKMREVSRKGYKSEGKDKRSSVRRVRQEILQKRGKKNEGINRDEGEKESVMKK